MADDVGNLLGQRGTFVYVTDSGESVNYTQDRSVGLAVSNALATTAERPVSVNNRYLKGRYVLVQAQDDPSLKKRIIVGNPASALFSSEVSTEIIINARIYVVTGRVGEQVSYLRLTPLITPP